jgi:diguanylate cyclase (GGDEF)-like protein
MLHDVCNDNLPRGGAAPAGAPAMTGAPAEVLIVDDETFLAEELALGIGDAGLAVAVAHSAAEAERVLAQRPEILVVVSDIRMPGGDGLSLARRLLAQRAEAAAIELVVMTGHATVEDAAAAVRAGAFDFIRKPFSLAAMIDVVRRAHARAAGRRDAARDDLDRQRQLAEMLEERRVLATEDAATGSASRASFKARLAAMTPAELAGAAVMLIGIDRLSQINAAAGSETGDAVLRQFADRLRAHLDPGVLVARSGDTEFAILVPQAPAPVLLRLRAEAIRQALEQPVRAGDQRWATTPSLGLACGDALGETPIEVAASVALQQARSQGGGRTVLFEASMRSAAARRLAIEQALLTALSARELTLFYQPLFDPQTRRLLGFEALLRWVSRQLGPVAPSEFIPVAEETGAVLAIGHWVLQSAARQAAAWRAAIGQGLYVAVNISRRQIDQPGFVAEVEALLATHGLPGDALVVELTESLAIGPAARPVVEALRRLGLGVALDDFGTGFSSLGTLCSLPVSMVKFDRSLLPPDGAAGDRWTLFRGFAGAVQALGLRVVAEGVETEAQLQGATAAGCGVVQGYLLGRPMPAEQADQLVAAFYPG